MAPPRQVAPGVILVDTGYVRPGVAAAWIVKGGASAAVIETGTARSVPHLLSALAAQGIAPGAVSHVIVTHVHLDHAAGAGALLAHLPAARLVVHPRGARHMIDPSKLLAGAAEVYGGMEAIRSLYGDVLPAPAARVIEAPEGTVVDLGGRTLRMLDTPGHAKHHFVVLDVATMGFFTGDSFGLSYRETDSAKGPFFFPTTTPVQFEPGALHATIDRMIGERPERVYLTHYGCVDKRLVTHADALHRGIDEHVRVAKAAAAGPGRHAAIKEGLTAYLLAGLDAHRAPTTRERALALFDNDLELNAQGLGVWLDGGAKG